MKKKETLKEWLYYEVWLGVEARVMVIGHWLQGHDVRWRYKPDWWVGCGGDLMCMKCPDSTDGKSDVMFWCRWKPWLTDIAQLVCSLRGHVSDVCHPQKGTGKEDANGDVIWEPIVDQWFCRRCGKELSTKRAAELIDQAHDEALKWYSALDKS